MSHGYMFIILSLPFYTAYMYAGVLSNYIIAELMDNGDNFMSYFITFIILSAIVAVGITFAYLCVMTLFLLVSGKLHRGMVERVLHAPMKYFDVTPSGLISNGFSKDINAIDNEYAFNLTWIIDCLFWVLAAIGIGLFVTGWILIFVPIVFFFSIMLLSYYIKTYGEVSGLETVSNSPILTNVSESIDGVTTIRAFKKTDFFIDLNSTHLNH